MTFPLRRACRTGPLAIALVIAVALWPSIAAAKGPTPEAPEPQGSFTVGGETPIEVHLSWPTNQPPLEEFVEDLGWDEDPHWSVLAVADSPATAGLERAGKSLEGYYQPAPGMFDEAEVLELTYVGDGTYTTAFVPPTAGGWLLVPATRDERSAWLPLYFSTRHIEVSEAPPTVPAADATSAIALPVGAELAVVCGALVVAAAMILVVHSKRSRISRSRARIGPAEDWSRLHP
jgi:hypothetical protein